MRMTLNDFPNTYNQMYCMEIYLTTHIPSGKKYIGKDVNSNPNYFGSGKLLKEIIKSEGKTNLVKKTLEVCNNKKHLAERERFWLEYYDVENNSEFLNLTNKPFGNSGLSQTTRNKISKSHQGKVIPDSVRKKMSKSRKGHSMYTEEWREKISKANKGKPKPKDFKEKVSKWTKGNTHRRLEILQYDLDNNFIKKWDSIKQAADFLGKQGAAIVETCKRKRNQAYNYIWRYAQD